jgi:hypothetical protein
MFTTKNTSLGNISILILKPNKLLLNSGTLLHNASSAVNATKDYDDAYIFWNSPGYLRLGFDNISSYDVINVTLHIGCVSEISGHTAWYISTTNGTCIPNKRYEITSSNVTITWELNPFTLSPWNMTSINNLMFQVSKSQLMQSQVNCIYFNVRVNVS